MIRIAETRGAPEPGVASFLHRFTAGRLRREVRRQGFEIAEEIGGFLRLARL